MNRTLKTPNNSNVTKVSFPNTKVKHIDTLTVMAGSGTSLSVCLASRFFLRKEKGDELPIYSNKSSVFTDP